MIPQAGVGVVVAMRSEAKLLLRTPIDASQTVPLSPQARLRLSGMGPQAAASAALQLLAEGVEALAVFGVAGGLDPDWPSGSLIVADAICDQHGRYYPTDAGWRQVVQQATEGRSKPARILSCDAALSSPLAKQQAGRDHVATAVDMESAAVAAVAAEHGVPLLVLRAIADQADDTLPPALQQAVDRFGQPQAGALLAAVLAQPRLIGRLPGLARAMQAATSALRQAAIQLGPDLAWSARQRAMQSVTDA